MKAGERFKFVRQVMSKSFTLKTPWIKHFVKEPGAGQSSWFGVLALEIAFFVCFDLLQQVYESSLPKSLLILCVWVASTLFCRKPCEIRFMKSERLLMTLLCRFGGSSPVVPLEKLRLDPWGWRFSSSSDSRP